MNNYEVRSIWEGQILDSREFDSEILAEAYYGSTEDLYRRSDGSEGVTVQLIDNETSDVLFERTF